MRGKGAIGSAALLRAKDMHGRSGGRSHGGQQAGEDRGGKKNDGNGKKCGEVEGLDAEEKALHGAADEVGADQAEAQSDGGKKDAVTNDEADDPLAAGAESHAQGDLMGALGHG